MNKEDKIYSIAFADDLVTYIAGNYPEETREKLETLVNKIDKYYIQWHQKINPDKCETIIFRRPTRNLSKKKKKRD